MRLFTVTVRIPGGFHHLAEPRPVLRGLRLGTDVNEYALEGHRLAEPRPVLRGLRPCNPLRGRKTNGSQLAEPRPVLRGLRRGPSRSGRGLGSSDLQSRDPFSGDCDATTCGTRGWSRSTLTCRAETRSQGIAIPGGPRLDPGGGPAPLQSRDPFSGDCDLEASCEWGGLDSEGLQSRDPFSGDCDVGATRRVAPTFLALRRLRE